MRLIDADKFKGKVIASHCYSGVNKLINVDDIPTAYDVDKVVEQLEERSKEYNSGVRLHGKPEEMLTDEAIEIVKRGGKEQ